MADLSVVISSQETFEIDDLSVQPIYEIETVGTIDANEVVIVDQFLFSSQLINDSSATTTRAFSSSKVEELLSGKQGTLTIDSTPTDGSTNPVQSDGVFDALALKQDALVSGTNIKTVNGASILGSGDIAISGGSGEGVTLSNTIPSIPTGDDIKLYADDNIKVADILLDLKPLTAETTAAYSVFYSTKYVSVTAYSAFNDDVQGWITSGGQSNEWIGIRFLDAPKEIKSYRIMPWSVDNFPSRSPKSWYLQGSNNGTDWTTIDTVSNWTTYTVSKYTDYFKVDAPNLYSYYRLYILSNIGNVGYSGVSALELNGETPLGKKIKYVDSLGTEADLSIAYTPATAFDLGAIKVGDNLSIDIDGVLSADTPTIDSLANVVITANSDNEVLAWNSATSKWINQTASEAGLSTNTHSHNLDDLIDVTAPTPSSGQVLTWNGSAWVNSTPTSGSGGGVLDSGMLLGNTALGLNYTCPYVITATNSGSTVPSAGRTQYMPFYINESITVSTMTINVTNAGATGAAALIGIYDSTTGRLPNNQLVVSSPLDCTTTGVKVFTLDGTITLEANTLYFMAFLMPSVAATVSTVPVAAGRSLFHTITPTSINLGSIYINSQTDLTNPATPPTIVGTAAFPIIMLGASLA